VSGQWLAKETSDTAVHVVPLDDVTVHEFSEDCPCGPHARIVPCEGRSAGWVHTHHSVDGREFSEPDYSDATEED
jgi:hypothetical protein